jgi:hypothetical protein
MIMVTWPKMGRDVRFVFFYAWRRPRVSARAGSRPDTFVTCPAPLPDDGMITLRVTRHDRNEQLLAECQSAVIPARGEVLQLDTVESDGSMSRPSTMWRIVAVTVHVPSIRSEEPLDGQPLRVRTVEVSVLPDVSLLPGSMQSAEQQLAESRM